MDLVFIGLFILLIVLIVLFCIAGYFAWEAGQPCWLDTPEQERARAEMNRKLFKNGWTKM